MNKIYQRKEQNIKMLATRGGIQKPRAIRARTDAIGQPRMTETALLDVARTTQIMEAIIKFQRECALLAIRKEETHKLLGDNEEDAPDCQSDVDYS
tara:strand:- start:16966 stop:17253 length:288 start_codon:yes stop_codon:yes gene_type:complete